MWKSVQTLLCVLLLTRMSRQGATIAIDNVDSKGVSQVQSLNQGQIYLQSSDPTTGANVLQERGTKYAIDRDPSKGLSELYPTPPPNFVTGVTPMHLTYQYLTTPQRITTPLNMYSYPRVHNPIYGLEHPMNMHHPYNNIFGMHPYMFTGSTGVQPHLFMNPAGYSGGYATNLGMASAARLSGVAGGPLTQQLAAQPGFNPTMSGVGPYGGGLGAFNPSQTPMGPWFYLAPFNGGQ